MKKRLEDRLPSRSRSLVSLLLALALTATHTPRGLAAPPPQAAAQRPIVVQAGAFRGPTASGVLVAQLEEEGFSPTVVPGDDYYRVVLGPFANDAEANAALSKLKGEGFDGYIRRDLGLPAQSAVAAPRTEAPTRQPPPQPRPQPAAPPLQAPAQTPVEPPAQPTRPQPGRTQPAPLTRVEPSRPPTVPITPEPAPPATPEQPVTTAQPPAQPPPVPRPDVPTRPVEPPEPAATPPAVAAAEPAPAPPVRPEARVSAPSTISAPVSVPQAGAPPAVGQARGVSSLKILVMEGEGAINNTRQRTARDPVIQVVDENDRPVGGVAVTFALPGRGASGVFANGARSMTILTDAQGMATATGLTPNTVAGDLAIQVSASHQGQTASAVIAQTNVAAGAGMSAATIGIIGAIAAGAAVGAVIAFKGGNDPVVAPPTAPPTGTATVRPGDVVISVP